MKTHAAIRHATHRLEKRTIVYFLLSLLLVAFVLRVRLGASHEPWPPVTHLKTSASIPLEQQREHTYKLHPQDHALREARVIQHQWRITSDHRRPDGVLKPVFLINEQFPGPIVEARSGDTLVVQVENALVTDSVSIHWHGLSMRNANDMDGAVGFTQSPIQPESRFTYNFTIADDQAGTFWYHASGVERGDGLYGGFIVHKPTGEQTAQSRLEDRYSVDLTPLLDEHLVLVGDWYHRTADDVLAWYMRAGSFGMEPVPDSLLVNGRGRFNCSDAVPARPLDCEDGTDANTGVLSIDKSRRSKLRVVNVGSYSAVSLKVPGASFTAAAVDGGHAVQLSTSADSVGWLYPGERVDLTIEPSQNQMGGLEVSIDTSPFKYQNPALTPTHKFTIDWTSSSSIPASVLTTGSDSDLSHMQLEDVVSGDAQQEDLTPEPDLILVLYTITDKLAHLDNVPRGSINRTIWEPQSPPLLNSSRRDWDDHQFVPKIPHNSTHPLWVDVVLNNLDEDNHPFHLHGHDFYVLTRYSSSYNWGSYNPFEDDTLPGSPYNLENPIKKDTVSVPRRGYAVIRFRADNPGIWMFHCHVLWHLESGMAMGFEVE